MAITNYTEDRDQKTFQQMYCLEASTGEIRQQLTSLSVINILLSITAFLGNSLILVALHKTSSLHPPSKILLRNLVTTDLFVGLLSEPLYAVYLMSVVNERWEVCHYTFTLAFIAGYLLGSVSFSTLTAISVDRLLALLLRLRYRQVVTSKRTSVTVVSLWAVSILATVMYFWNYLITLWYSYIAIPLCLAISITSYSKIFCMLRHIHNPIQPEPQQNQTIPLNIARYRKAVSSSVWVQLALFACYLPFVIDGVVGRVLSTQGELSSPAFLVKVCTITLSYLNSSLNPILYCWKIREVRQAVKDTIRQVLCCS